MRYKILIFLSIHLGIVCVSARADAPAGVQGKLIVLKRTTIMLLHLGNNYKIEIASVTLTALLER